LLDVIPVVVAATGVLFENVDSIFVNFQMKKTNKWIILWQDQIKSIGYSERTSDRYR